MNRKIKALGLALVAALALTAVMASAASAQFTSDKEHTILSGSQEGSHVFTAGEGFGGITCSTATFAGTGASKEAASQVITPTYTGCKDTFGRTAHVTVTGTYEFTTNPDEVHLEGHIVVEITSGGSTVCTVTIGEQDDINGIAYDNLGGTSGVRVTTSSNNIDNTTSGGFFNCGIANGAHSEGTYNGTTVMTGKGTDNAAAAISID